MSPIATGTAASPGESAVGRWGRHCAYDEVFGEENFFAQIIIRANSRGHTYKQIAKTHEYLVAYTANPETE